MNLKSIAGFVLVVGITGLLFYFNLNRHYSDPGFTMAYEDGLKNFESAFVDHFPKDFNSENSTLHLSDDINTSHPGIWLKTEIESSYADTLLNFLQAKSIASYSPSDSCLLVVDSHLTEDNWLTYDKTERNGREARIINKDCHKGVLPVPKFWTGGLFETKDTKVGIKNTYRLFVLDSKSGPFRNLDSLPNGKYTYQGWDHGYTKGIALDRDREQVIFWFDIW
jgi:hypothetical protein